MEWRVEVYSADGDFLFTYLGILDENMADEDAPLTFECVVMSAPGRPSPPRETFDSFHGLISFLMGIALLDGQCPHST